MRGARIVFVLPGHRLRPGGGSEGRWAEIGDAAAATGAVRLCLSVAVAAAGLALTGVLWRNLLAGLGSPVPLRDAGAVFFVGQLGKYVPGSVWSFAVQAQLGRRHGVPARSSVTASALFLLLHTFSGLVLGGLLVAGGVVSTGLDTAWWLLVVVGGAVALAPPVLRFLGRRPGRGRDRLRHPRPRAGARADDLRVGLLRREPVGPAAGRGRPRGPRRVRPRPRGRGAARVRARRPRCPGGGADRVVVACGRRTHRGGSRPARPRRALGRRLRPRGRRRGPGAPDPRARRCRPRVRRRRSPPYAAARASPRWSRSSPWPTSRSSAHASSCSGVTRRASRSDTTGWPTTGSPSTR
ncbi:flippase-like domain-containing protein [Nocardioides sp. B-3]|uniref:flippase-like domain-containing protein n=1 Tax=Nocardioides sp. B-3 TaxID=2895565 RepID=UPI002152D8A7|nr:flippase-like domain-containing protein [Nocardioides sp. B-3]UUZ59991.1 flippase-like domain-containing protein [Nocardioides sp. B-3]